jgi:hypothetical protein
MKVRVVKRNRNNGWISPAIVTVTIADTCPVCGGPRGSPYNYNWHEDGDWYSCDRWDNPCGHVDKYDACLAEATQAAAGPAEQ